jgi:hypothetical protein
MCEALSIRLHGQRTFARARVAKSPSDARAQAYVCLKVDLGRVHLRKMINAWSYSLHVPLLANVHLDALLVLYV